MFFQWTSVSIFHVYLVDIYGIYLIICFVHKMDKIIMFCEVFKLLGWCTFKNDRNIVHYKNDKKCSIYGCLACTAVLLDHLVHYFYQVPIDLLVDKKCRMFLCHVFFRKVKCICRTECTLLEN